MNPFSIILTVVLLALTGVAGLLILGASVLLYAIFFFPFEDHRQVILRSYEPQNIDKQKTMIENKITYARDIRSRPSIERLIRAFEINYVDHPEIHDTARELREKLDNQWPDMVIRQAMAK